MNWRETVLFLYPNGDAPLTAIMSKMKSEKTDDPQYHWWTKNLPDQAGAVTGVWINAALNVAYVSGGVAGNTLYIQMAAATVAHFRVGHVVLLRDTSHPDVDCIAKVAARTVNGASSYLTVTLLEADDNGASTDLSNCDRIIVRGS